MNIIKDAYPEIKRDLKFIPLGVDEPNILNKNVINSYNKNGFFFPLNVFNEQEINKIRFSFDAIFSKALSKGWNSYQIINWHKYCASIYDIVTNKKIIQIVKDFLGESVILRHSHFFVKLPGDKKIINWHQDASYWPLSMSKVITVWLAIDDVDFDNGAMKFITGSHINNQIPYKKSLETENNVLNQTVDNPENYGKGIQIVKLKPGQISLHSDWTLHASDENLSKKRRCGLAMRFLTNEVKAFNNWNTNSIICSGDDPSGHWYNHKRPGGDNIPNID